MKALSLIQPWAWAVAHGGKRIENRVWAWLRHGLPSIRKRVAEGERIAIHASSTPPRGRDLFGVANALNMNVQAFLHENPTALDKGIITCTCTIDDVLRAENPDEPRDDASDRWPSYRLSDADVFRFRQRTDQPWAEQIRLWWLGPYALALGNVLPVPEKVYAIGRQMFWQLRPETHEKLVRLGVA